MLLVLAIITFCNIISSFVFTRFDLTSEKRYTLSDKTKEMLKNLDDVVYFKIYLEGDFPAGFDRLHNSTKEMLDEFRAYSNNNIEYEFINPAESAPSKEEQNEVYKQLYEKGLEPTLLDTKDNAESSQQIIFPGAIATFKGHEMAIQLFKNQVGVAPEVVLNNSIEALEYELSNTIRKLQVAIKPRVAFVEGQHELDTLATSDFRHSLEEYYSVEQFKLNGMLTNLKDIKKYKAIIIEKPDSAFREPEKFIIDQYIMNGGKVLWLIDNVYTSMDSLAKSPMTYGMQVKLNLDDQLFKYGARVNADLIQDVKCSAIPLPVNNTWVLKPWLFFPLVREGSDNPIVKNLNAVRLEFASSIDTVATNSSIKKTILLSTSKYSNALIAPVRIDLRMATREPTPQQFKRSYVPVAVLLEGEFESVFKNRLPPKIDSISGLKYADHSVKTQMIVVSDGDVGKSVMSHNQPMPLGFDQYTQQTYGNKNFLLNAMNYLCDESGLLTVRSRELVLRLLDKEKVKAEKTKWKVVNTVVPILVVILFGLIRFYLRRRKYTS